MGNWIAAFVTANGLGYRAVESENGGVDSVVWEGMPSGMLSPVVDAPELETRHSPYPPPPSPLNAPLQSSPPPPSPLPLNPHLRPSPSSLSPCRPSLPSPPSSSPPSHSFSPLKSPPSPPPPPPPSSTPSPPSPSLLSPLNHPLPPQHPSVSSPGNTPFPSPSPLSQPPSRSTSPPPSSAATAVTGAAADASVASVAPAAPLFSGDFGRSISWNPPAAIEYSYPSRRRFVFGGCGWAVTTAVLSSAAVSVAAVLSSAAIDVTASAAPILPRTARSSTAVARSVSRTPPPIIEYSYHS
ncbi:hypothetical protein HJC23_014016 [Cyclotella cryptica]|uniref:Uncharacterized protein n=1 Tax=Cyclotella cryptica TaxID=29204 RepID=A0ABD3QTF1_9STRA